MYKAIIFDFDGVVADTMKDNCKAWQMALETFGIKIDPIEYYVLEGMGRFQISNHFIIKYNLNPDLNSKIAETKEHFYSQINNFSLYPDITSILVYIKKTDLKIGLVTGASRNRIYKYVNEVFLTFFDVIITADDVINSKPNPEPYQKAIDYLNFDSSECLIIENASLGITSAKAAGCYCMAIETTLSSQYLKEADEIFATHKELFKKIKTLIKHFQI
jgi:beta-phosphoglucomutase